MFSFDPIHVCFRCNTSKGALIVIVGVAPVLPGHTIVKVKFVRDATAHWPLNRYCALGRRVLIDTIALQYRFIFLSFPRNKLTTHNFG